MITFDIDEQESGKYLVYYKQERDEVDSLVMGICSSIAISFARIGWYSLLDTKSTNNFFLFFNFLLFILISFSLENQKHMSLFSIFIQHL